MRLLMKQYNKKKDVNKNVNRWAKKDWWGEISYFQKLSEKFIEKHKDKINWYWVSYYQTISEDFIEKHKDKIDWGWVSYSRISKTLPRI